MRSLCRSPCFFSVTLPAIVEELHAVEPKTVIDGDTFYVSVRFLDIDAPEFATTSIEMLYEFQPGDMGGPFCLAFGRERPEQRRHPIDQLLAINRKNGKGGGPLPVCCFL